MELVLVRHALPVRIDAAPDGAPADPQLAPRGHEQAQRLVAALAATGRRALHLTLTSSPGDGGAPRRRPGLEPEVEAGLAEFDTADSSYVPVEELKAAGDPRWTALVHGDLYSVDVDPVAFRARVVEAVERIAARHPGGRVVLFSHAGAINAATGAVLGQQRTIWFAPDYCSISRIAAARDGRRGIVSLNETGHVRDLLSRG